ncbi:HalOD1 output domain-containing protein [Halomicroarcula sp. GCM10025709]|uniref:HalOD1 output domain-containing protein n=1 Tax=Halomicroarcula sp. GCM10025709 TaxID=3252669 RepID=UPI00361009C0
MSQPETSVSVRVVEAVARARGVDPQALPPLQNAIEAEAMDAMYTHASADSAERTPRRFCSRMQGMRSGSGRPPISRSESRPSNPLARPRLKHQPSPLVSVSVQYVASLASPSSSASASLVSPCCSVVCR